MARLRVQVVYALPRAQRVAALELAPGATARDAVEASGLLGARIAGPDLNLAIFGKRVRPDRTLHDGERVEILRPLAVDPREARRRRARRR